MSCIKTIPLDDADVVVVVSIAAKLNGSFDCVGLTLFSMVDDRPTLFVKSLCIGLQALSVTHKFKPLTQSNDLRRALELHRHRQGQLPKQARDEQCR